MKRNTVLRILSLALAALLILVLSLLRQPGQTASDQSTTQTTAPVIREDKLVGICLPAQTEEWMDAGYLLKSQLESRSYQVELSFGDATSQGQTALLRELIEGGADCLIAAPVDSAALTEAEEAARSKGIPVLAYGSLLMDTNAVSGYICYDYFGMGADIARYVESRLGLADGNGSFTVELFMGSPRDYNAILLHNGLLSVLQRYIDSGVLVCKSGRLAFEDSCITDWAEDTAKQSCRGRLKSSYAGSAPDVLICASDSIAAGVISALEEAGVQKDAWPLITGNGATQAGMDNLRAGKQCLTVRTDAADPAAACAAMVDRVLFGVEPDFTVSEVFNNVVSVPTALCGFELIDE